jgi:hypothetical protein
LSAAALVLVGTVSVAAILHLRSGAAASLASGRVQVTLHIAQQPQAAGRTTGGGPTTTLPSGVSSAPAGSAAAPQRVKGTFSINGVLHDAGSLRLVSGRAGTTKPTSLYQLIGRRGQLRLLVSGGGATGGASGTTVGPAQGSWSIQAGSATAAYAQLRGQGKATISQQLIVLTGVVHG